MKTLIIPDGGFDIPTITPPPLPPPHARHLSANLILSGYMPDHLDFVSRFALRAAHVRGIPAGGSDNAQNAVIHLETTVEKWHVTRGPFVHDKTKDVFERLTYKRLVQAFNADEKVIDDWITYINQNLPAGINLTVERYTWHPTSSLSTLSSTLRAQLKAEQDALAHRLDMTQGPAVPGVMDEGMEDEKDGEDVGSGEMRAATERKASREAFVVDVKKRAEAFVKAAMAGSADATGGSKNASVTPQKKK